MPRFRIRLRGRVPCRWAGLPRDPQFDRVYLYGYTSRIAAFLRTPELDAWLRALHDPIGKARIIARIRSAESGNFGDSSAVGGGVFEMRIHVGPRYRVYYCRRGKVTYLLLCGGDKSSQRRDIRVARDLLSSLESQS